MKDKMRRAIFRSKLDGTFDTIVRHAFMSGYTRGHKFGQTMGQLIPSDLEKAHADYKTILENKLRNNND